MKISAQERMPIIDCVIIYSATLNLKLTKLQKTRVRSAFYLILYDLNLILNLNK